MENNNTMHSLKISKTLKIGILGLLLISITINSVAQTTTNISLEGAKTKAKEKNLNHKLSQQDYAVAKAQYESSRAVLLPQIRISNTSTFTNNPLHAFGFKLLQRDVNAIDFDPALLNNPGDVENFNTRIELVQPLINIDGWKERKTANLNMAASQLNSERTSEYIELEVTKTYMQLQLAYKIVNVYKKAQETALENQEWAKNNLEQGLIQNAAYLNIKVHTTEVINKLQSATTHIQNVSEYLAFLMGHDKNALLFPSDDLILSEIQDQSSGQLNPDRKDLIALNISLEAQEKMLQSSKMRFVPRANAVANYEWNDNTFMGFGANNYLLGFQLSWDVFNGYKNLGKIHKEKALLEKASLNQEKYIAESEMELNKAKRAHIDSKNKVDLSNLAREQSKEVLRITTNRFKQGLEKSKDLLTAETQYQEKELEYFQSIFNYNFSLAYLKYLTR